MNTFALTFRKHFADNRRQMLLLTASTAVCALICGFLMALAGGGGGEGQVIGMTMLLTALSCVAASFAFSSMKSPRDRIATLMTPSSIADKFFICWIFAVPANGLLMFAAFWLTELSRVILWPIFNQGDTATWLHLPDWDTRVMLLIISAAIASQAFFFFGAIVWPRLSFFKTLLAGWIISTLATCILAIFDDNVLWGVYDNKSLLLYFMIGTNIIVSLILYWLAYLRFSESDIADRLI